MQLSDDVRELTRGLAIGTRDDRTRIRAALSEFFEVQGYTAEIGSFNKGILMLFAAPAEHALLRYDMGALRAHLEQSGLSGLVRDVKVRAKPVGVAA